MLRRCPAPLMILAAALGFGLGSQPMSSRADALKVVPAFTAYDPSSMTSTDISQWKPDSSIQIKFDGIVNQPPSNSGSVAGNSQWLEYTLTTTRTIPSAGPSADAVTGSPTPQVLALDSPISIVTPASNSSHPLAVASDSTGYYDQADNSKQILVGIGDTTLQDKGSPVQVQALGLSFYGPGLKAGASLSFELPFDPNVVGHPSADLSNSGSGSSPGSVAQQGGTGGGSTETPEPLSLLLWSALAGASVWRARSRRPGSRP